VVAHFDGFNFTPPGHHPLFADVLAGSPFIDEVYRRSGPLRTDLDSSGRIHSAPTPAGTSNLAGMRGRVHSTVRMANILGNL
jgi:hypothetical protein